MLSTLFDCVFWVGVDNPPAAPFSILQASSVLKIQFNLRGREWNGPQGIKYFNTLEAWRIEKGTGGGLSTPAQNTQSNNVENTSSPVFTSNVNDNDDLPF